MSRRTKKPFKRREYNISRGGIRLSITMALLLSSYLLASCTLLQASVVTDQEGHKYEVKQVTTVSTKASIDSVNTIIEAFKK